MRAQTPNRTPGMLRATAQRSKAATIAPTRIRYGDRADPESNDVNIKRVGAHIKKYSADIEGRNDATDGDDADIERDDAEMAGTARISGTTASRPGTIQETRDNKRIKAEEGEGKRTWCMAVTQRSEMVNRSGMKRKHRLGQRRGKIGGDDSGAEITYVNQ
jgi:hypothetical protein